MVQCGRKRQIVQHGFQAFFFFFFFVSGSLFIFMKIESWQLSNLLKAYFQSVIQSVLHNPVNKVNTGALQCCLVIQFSDT